MWLIARYEPVALFSLKSGLATATGAKTLLVPTPFAIRSALLDVAIRQQGQTFGPEAFALIHQLTIAIRPSHYAVVTNLFAKIQKPARTDKEGDEAMKPTIAFREYVHWQGELQIAFQAEQIALEQIARWIPLINYLGKRGGFIQLSPPLEQYEPDWADSWSLLGEARGGIRQELASFPLGVVQVVDDWGGALTYEKVNAFDTTPIKRPSSGQDRLRYGVIVPYQFYRAGRNFTSYKRISNTA
jgi:hypothetical protein